MDLQSLKLELVSTIHFLHAKGWAPATSSNYSFKKEEEIWISASGIDKGHFSEENLMRIDPDGNPVNDGRKPSAETLLHTMLYSMYPDAACILHTHTVYNTVLSLAHQPGKKISMEGYEVIKGFSGHSTHETRLDIPVFANSQDIAALSGEIRGYLIQHPSCPGFLLAGHGLYTWGKSIPETKRHIEVFEFLFECIYKLQLYKKSL